MSTEPPINLPETGSSKEYRFRENPLLGLSIATGAPVSRKFMNTIAHNDAINYEIKADAFLRNVNSENNENGRNNPRKFLNKRYLTRNLVVWADVNRYQFGPDTTIGVGDNRPSWTSFRYDFPQNASGQYFHSDYLPSVVAGLYNMPGNQQPNDYPQMILTMTLVRPHYFKFDIHQLELGNGLVSVGDHFWISVIAVGVKGDYWPANDTVLFAPRTFDGPVVPNRHTLSTSIEAYVLLNSTHTKSFAIDAIRDTIVGFTMKTKTYSIAASIGSFATNTKTYALTANLRKTKTKTYSIDASVGPTAGTTTQIKTYTLRTGIRATKKKTYSIDANRLVSGGGGGGNDPIIIIWMENKERSTIITGDAPYLNAFRAAGTDFTKFYGVSHPSLPNYLAFACGSTSGKVGTDSITAGEIPGTSLWNQLQTAGVSWGVYEESMPSIGYGGGSSGRYQLKHNPAIPFANVYNNTTLRNKVVPYTLFDVNNLPDVSFITPDMCSDMHDCSVRTGDNWLAARVPAMLNKGATVIITFDEGSTSTNGGGNIYTAMRGQGVSASVNATTYNHYSVLRAIEDKHGLTRLGGAASASAIPLP